MEGRRPFPFSHLDFDLFFSFSFFTISGLDERKIIFFFLALCCLFLLIEEVCGFLIPSLLTYHMSYLQLYRFCLALMLRLTTGEITFTLYWSASTDLVTLFIYCTEYILLDNISYSLLVVKARQFRFANKIGSGWTIGLPAD